MTAKQKQQILEMKKLGLTYPKIADAIGLPKNTVKTFCWRSRNALCDTCKETGTKEKNHRCEYCKKPLEQRPKQKPRRFCNESCRLAWWKNNRDSLNQKAVYSLVCTNCGKGFDSYGNKSRKYCCHECYIAARFSSREAAV